MKTYNLIFLCLFGLGVLISLIRILYFYLKKEKSVTDKRLQETLRGGDYWLMTAACFLLVFYNQDHPFFIRDIVWIMGLIFSFVVPFAVRAVLELIVVLFSLNKKVK